MKARMKLLDLRLLMILAGFAAPVAAAPFAGGIGQDSIGCAESVVCAGDGQALFSLKQRPTQAASQKIISLPNNGMIWLTENPNMGSAELSVSAPTYVPFYDGKIMKPVEFHVRSNYSAFVSKYEILIYRGNDVDLVTPVAIVPVDVNAITSVNWSGELPENIRFRLNDDLRYVVRAYDREGHFDETYAKEIRLVTPAEDDRGNIEIRDSISKIKGQVLTQEEALTDSLIDAVVGSNDLYRQNIPFIGSRIRIQGSNLPEGGVYIDGESYPVDQEKKFEADFLVPLGARQFNVEVSSPFGGKITRTLETDITGDSFFMVGIADFTLYQKKVTGAGQETVQVDDDGNSQTSDLLSDGRLAFYLKSRMKGRYTITAHADTKEREIKHLFRGFGRAYPEDVFRSLDPDLYYPTYGDDSTVYRDVDTMGRFYARVDWDKNQALWGNFNTGITGTEFGTYSRSLYGGAVDLRTNDNTIYGDTKGTLRMFGSQAQSAPGHSEFLGTGGSLYYLRHTQVLPGSDKVQVKVVDPSTGLTQALIFLERGVDYEFDAVQGRLILTRPLLQIVSQHNPSIITEGPLNGFEQYLLVDYEFIPSGFDPKDVTRGGRGQYWLNDHLAVGVTYVDERQAGQSAHEIMGFDTILKAGNGTYLRAEYTHTRNAGVPTFYSDNGGLNFTQIDRNDGNDRKGDAYAVEGRVNLREQGVTERDVQTGAWYKRTEKGFSNGYSSNISGMEEYGFEISAELSDNFLTYIRHSVAKQDQNSYSQSQVSAEYRFENDSTITGELKQVQTENNGLKAIGKLAAVRYSMYATPDLEVYGIGQLTIDDDNKKYAKNNMVTLGASYFYGDNSSINIEGATGTRGHSILAGFEHKLNPDHTVYANYTFANQKSDYDSVFNNSQTGLTVGQRWRLTDRLNIFNEVQSLRGNNNEKGLANTIGADYLLDDGWSTNITFQQSRLKRQMNSDEGDEKGTRNAVSASISKTDEIIEYSSKLEYRRDNGIDDRRQWLTTNRISYKFDESLRFQGKFNYSESYDYVTRTEDAKFVDSGIGFAYRPWDNNKWAAFGRYNYYYDDASSGQVGYGSDYDQKSHIFSMEGVYKQDANWEYAAKVAYRKSDTRFGYLNNTWFDSSALFAAAQVRYDIYNKWHVIGEYRALKVKDGGTKSGLLLGIDKDITDNFRIGVGYNFTDFSDDLTQQDYRFKGFYINFVGYY
ncbi:hypothetical protein [Ignatzschineria sp. LJL83]